MPASAAPQINAGGIPAAGIGSLSTLLRRLEAATARLEDIAMTSSPSGGPHFISGASAVQGASAGAPATGGAAAPPVAAADAASTNAATSPAVKDFQDLLDSSIAKYASLSQELGGLVAEQSQHVLKAFQSQRDYIEMASKCLKPTSQSALEPLLKPTQTSLMAAIDVKEKNRASKDSNQLTVVAEGIPALGWVVMEGTPGPFIGEHKDSAEFWVLRVLKQHKDSDPKQVEWARSFTAALVDLQKYVKQHHTTGLTWNPKGVPAESYSSSSTASPTAAGAPAAPAPPPPPPPPPPAAPAAPPAPAVGGGGAAPAGADMGAVFSQLNQGEAITKSLRKVDKSEMTHKNPELRASSVVPDSGASKGPTKPPKPSSMQKKPPKTALEGKVWNIENHDNNREIVIEDTELNQAVNVFNVKSSVIQIKGKVNAVSLVNCPKTSVLIDSALSSVSVSSSPSFTIQILGKVPTITVDGCDSGQIYLSKSSLEVEIITAKTSSINVSLPVEGEDDGVFEEKAVPEQLKTIVKDGKLVTSVVEHAG
ncbi:suppressor of rasval19 [Microbotryomycetes sp. JL221]|nr:suppressor of rasval19 [Microbotryomycetes sp. JL221]